MKYFTYMVTYTELVCLMGFNLLKFCFDFVCVYATMITVGVNLVVLLAFCEVWI